MTASAQVLLASDDRFIDALLEPPARLVSLLVRPPLRVLRICAEPAPEARPRARAQRDWWPEDSQAIDRTREKPRSTGLRLSELERSHALEREIRRLPLIDERIPSTDGRPRTRGDCADVPRPCPFIGCKYNNYANLTPSGALKPTWPNLEPWEVNPELSCALDVADRGGAGMKTVATATNLTEERIRQEQVSGFRTLRKKRVGREWLRSIRGV